MNLARSDNTDCSTAERTATIRQLNDTLRREGKGGWTMVTNGITALPKATQDRILSEVASFGRFDAANDPFGEHDFGTVRVDGTLAMFKIDYYDQTLEHASPDAADEAVTRRVVTIMTAEEY